MDIYVQSGGVPVIKVGEICYELVGLVEEAPNAVAEDTFETCEECEGSSAPSGEVSQDSSAESSDACGESDTCGTPNGDPTLLVTLTWTDSDDTKQWLGCTWCNGQQKEVYATLYDASTVFTGTEQEWDRNLSLRMRGFHYDDITSDAEDPQTLKLTLKTVLGNIYKDDFRWYGSTGTAGAVANDLGIINVTDVENVPAGLGNQLLTKMKNNSYTDANGITYTWTEGTGW